MEKFEYQVELQVELQVVLHESFPPSCSVIYRATEVRLAKRQVRGVQPGAIAGRHAPLVEKIIPADASKCQECAGCKFMLVHVSSSKVINRQIN